MLLSRVPAFGKESFGPGLDVTVFRHWWAFSQARVLDGALYVTYEYLGPGKPFVGIGLLSGGVLHQLRLRRGDYSEIHFMTDNRIISATRPRDGADWYSLLGAKADPIPRPSSPAFGEQAHLLADGDQCFGGAAGSGSAIVEKRKGRLVRLVSSAALSRATFGAMSQAVDVYCDHFHGRDYASSIDPDIILQIDGGNVRLVGAGQVMAASDRRLLIETRNGVLVEADAR